MTLRLTGHELNTKMTNFKIHKRASTANDSGESVHKPSDDLVVRVQSGYLLLKMKRNRKVKNERIMNVIMIFQ